jgi:hypothetical protein
MRSRSAWFAIALMGGAALCAACGGGGDEPPPVAAPAPGPPAVPAPPPAPAVAKAEAFRFLNQATFGATEAEAARLMALGDSSNAYAHWLDLEFAKPAALLLPAVEAAYPNPVPAGFNLASLNAPRVCTCRCWATRKR